MYIITIYILFSLGRKILQFGQFRFLVFLSVSNLWALVGMFLNNYLEIQGHWKITELTHKMNVLLENKHLFSKEKPLRVLFLLFNYF